ncbi:MAG: hypothetical protein ACLR8P_06875 [Clostridium fessum]
MKELQSLKEKDTKFYGSDTRNGMTAVVAVKHPDPIFEGQTKTKLAVPMRQSGVQRDGASCSFILIGI